MNEFITQWYSRSIFNFQPSEIKQLLRKIETKSKQLITNNLHQEFNNTHTHIYIIYIYEELIIRFHISEWNYYLNTDRVFLIGWLVSYANCKRYQGKILIKLQRIKVSKLLPFITGRLDPWIIIESTHGLNQSSKQNDQSFISILDYPWPVGSN